MKFLRLALAAFCIVAGFAGKTAVAADTVKISISNVEGSFLFGAVAAKKGFFAEEYLERGADSNCRQCHGSGHGQRRHRLHVDVRFSGSRHIEWVSIQSRGKFCR